MQRLPLSASDVMAPPAPELRVLRCPECSRLRLKTQVAIQKGQITVEDLCRGCGTKTLWTLDSTKDTRYTVIERGRHQPPAKTT
jgi:hypothetical protein